MVNKYVIDLDGYKEDGQKLLNFNTLGPTTQHHNYASNIKQQRK